MSKDEHMTVAHDLQVLREQVKHIYETSAKPVLTDSMFAGGDVLRREISAKKCSEGTFVLKVNDHLETHIASRGIITFDSTDEVKQAIRALLDLLPAVDRLADLAE